MIVVRQNIRRFTLDADCGQSLCRDVSVVQSDTIPAGGRFGTYGMDTGENW